MKIFNFATATAAIALSATMVPSAANAQADEPLLGQLMPVGFNFCPRGWSAADGQILPINTNQALFSLYGTTFGGDGRTTFALPDLRGRVPMHQGQGPGLTDRRWGERGGSETAFVSVAQLAAHSHTGTINVSRINATTRAPANAYFARSAGLNYEEDTAPTGDTMHAGVVQTTNTGGNQSHNNMQPYQVINWCVALQGLFPSRN